MKYSIGQIREIAQGTRSDFENGGLTVPDLQEVYDRYVPEPARPIDGYEEDFDLADFPAGKCTLATAVLRDRIGYGEFVLGAYGTRPHTYLEVETDDSGAVVVDVTADQFTGGPEVYVGSLRAPWAREWHIEPVDPEESLPIFGE